MKSYDTIETQCREFLRNLLLKKSALKFLFVEKISCLNLDITKRNWETFTRCWSFDWKKYINGHQIWSFLVQQTVIVFSGVFQLIKTLFENHLEKCLIAQREICNAIDVMNCTLMKFELNKELIKFIRTSITLYKDKLAKEKVKHEQKDNFKQIESEWLLSYKVS